MEDKVGFVMPPKPDGTENYHSYLFDNIMVIPSCYDAETAADIAYAYNLYTSGLMAEEGGEGWQEPYYFYFWNKKVVDGEAQYFPDDRAVEETFPYFSDYNNVKQTNRIIVHNLENVIGKHLLWHYPFDTIPPEEQIKKISEEWDALIEEANRGRRNTDEE